MPGPCLEAQGTELGSGICHQMCEVVVWAWGRKSYVGVPKDFYRAQYPEPR